MNNNDVMSWDCEVLAVDLFSVVKFWLQQFRA